MEKIQTIYKYPINSGEPITAPFVKILDIQYQEDDLYMWAIVEPESESTITVVPTVVGTGWPHRSFSTLGKYFKNSPRGFICMARIFKLSLSFSVRAIIFS